MRLFNSLSQKVEELVPIQTGAVGMYSCGPTVYSNLHIGNLAAFIYADVLRRALALSGYNVRHVMNITDVDDKTIRDSKATYPDDDPLLALQKLTDTYTAIFKADIAAVGIDTQAIEFVSAVTTIPEMITLIQRILDANIGYVAEEGIYFSVARYAALGHTYGRLQKVDTAQSQSRIAHDEYDKDHASDFALWKAATAGEPAWDAQFTIEGEPVTMPGRPGWHIECSAMSQVLGMPFDIHTGGIDLKFPHHENEIAQSVAAGAEDLSRFFIHNNHILVDGRKMSKSLGNITTLREVEAHGFSPMAFRLLVLESHYQKESNFSWDILEAAANRLKRWQMTADLVWQDDLFELTELDIDTFKFSLMEAMTDNLNTPKTIAEIDTQMTDIAATVMNRDNQEAVKDYLLFVEQLLGIQLLRSDISDTQRNLLKRRQKAREQEQWDASDQLRKELESSGIGVKDTPRGQQWYRLV